LLRTRTGRILEKLANGGLSAVTGAAMAQTRAALAELSG
jgi:hypothetical protein